MADLISMLAAASGIGAEEADPNFKQTVLLLHGDGTNGAQNNTFLDSSSNTFTITRNPATGPNAPTQGTFSPFSLSGGYWSNYFDGTDDYLSVADNAVLRPGAGAFTLEAWVYRNASGAAHTVYAKGGASTGIVLQVTSTNVLRFTHTTTNIDSTGTVAANAWVHVAVVREGTGTNQTKLYINGVQDGQGTVSTDFTQTEEVRIGTNRGATDDFAGYISNVRFVKGSALYTAGFTPSTVPLTTTSQGASSSEVELLTCQSNRFVDNSTNAFAITRNGDVKVTPFSPFAPTAAYSAGTNGGSGYFDGTGDYLSVADNAAFQYGSGNFTIEAWIYRTNSGADQQIIGSHEAGSAASWLLYVTNTNKLRMLVNNSTFAESAGTIPVNAWTHIVGIRDGNNLYVYINGVQDGSVAFSTTINSNAYAITIAADQNGDETNYSGYIASLRIIKGQALTTGAFTPPTTPVTTSAVGWTGANVAASITGTVSLLCNFTNAGIFDNTGKNNLETVGNAQIDTAVKKFGTGSMKFDGTDDRIFTPSSVDLIMGTGNFTIEGWFYANSTSNKGIFQLSSAAGGLDPSAATANIAFALQTNGYTVYAANTGTTITSVVPSTTTWTHFAIVRSSGVTRLYINGSQAGSNITDTTNYAGGNLVVGGYYSTTYLFNGYIDDLRITKGIARTITVPTAAFPDL